MRIYGAGLAGLVAGHVFRQQQPEIHEAQKELPNNHAALLRFRTDAASTATGIKFKKVVVDKAVLHSSMIAAGQTSFTISKDLSIINTNNYSQKVSGKIMDRSIKNLDSAERYVAPPNFIERMAVGMNIKYDSPLTLDVIKDLKEQGVPIISTIPMPVLMGIVGWEQQPVFDFKPIWSLTCDIESPSCDVYQTVYVPHLAHSYYRISITGNHMIAEYMTRPERTLDDGSKTGLNEEELKKLCEIHLATCFGLWKDLKIVNIKTKSQQYGKLLPCDDKLRKEFIMAMTDQYGIYSLGRFATWRQLLIDDIVKDCYRIDKFIEQDSKYSRIKSATK